MNHLVLYSSVHPSLLKKVLFKGFLLGLIGVLIILFSGTFLPPNILKIWGVWVFILGITLIAWGLIPYRKLSRLAAKPNQILVSKDHLEYYSGGILKMSLLLQTIEKWDFIQQGTMYGIRIEIKSKSNDLEKEEIFLPYFSKRSFNELKEMIE